MEKLLEVVDNTNPNTLILFTSDHGAAFARGKLSLCEILLVQLFFNNRAFVMQTKVAPMFRCSLHCHRR